MLSCFQLKYSTIKILFNICLINKKNHEKIYFIYIAYHIFCGYTLQTFAQITLYESGFDEMTAGEYFVLNDGSGFWPTWSDEPGTAEDAFVSDEQSASPSNSVELEGTSDLLFLAGNKTSGKYQIEVEYYVLSGFGGHINLQHFEVPGTEWAVQIMFGAATGSENGYMEVGGEVEPFTFLHDQWLQLKFIVDLDEDWTEFFIDDVLIYEWPFSYTPFETTGTKQLGAVNVFAGAPEGIFQIITWTILFTLS